MTTTDHNLKLRVLLAACWLAWHGCHVVTMRFSDRIWVQAIHGQRLLDVQLYNDGTADYSTERDLHTSHPLTIFDIDPLCSALTST